MLPKKKKKKSKLWRKLDSIEQSPQPYAGTQTDPVLDVPGDPILHLSMTST